MTDNSKPPKVVINLKAKEGLIPRNDDGDPQFLQLWQTTDGQGGVLNVFTDAEVVALVNRALYQMEYQRNSHRKYQQEQRNLEKPIKELLKELFPGVSWINATPQQITRCMEEYKKRNATATG